MSEPRSYTTTITVDAGPEHAFDAINNVQGWWSEEVTGVTDKEGGEFDYHYQDVHRCRARVRELVPGKKVVWRIVDNHFSFVPGRDEWLGTDVVFDIAPSGGGTQVTFTHVGLFPQYECYDVCANAWAGYIEGSLKDLIDTGRGLPNPKENGEAPAHQERANVHRAARAS